MPISIHYDYEQNVLFSTATGSISLDDIMSYYSEIEHMDLKPQYSVLADCSEASIKLNYDDIVKMTTRRSIISHGAGLVKIAVVAKGGVVFGMARMYGSLLGDKHFAVNVFRDRGEAVQWLRISEKQNGYE